MRNYHKIIVAVIFYVALLILIQKIWENDCKDRRHPYGLDMDRNNKYANGITGEKYGVSVYWGMPREKDRIIDSLNRIEWLSDSHTRDVLWRRAIIVSIILSVLIIFVVDWEQCLDIRKVLFCVPLAFLFFYFSTAYYTHHVGHYRTQYIKSNIRKLRKRLKIRNSGNPIYEKI